MRFSFLICILLLVQTGTQAQKKQWTLAQCLEYAHANNLKLRSNQASLDIIKTKVQASHKNRLPNVYGSASDNVRIGRSIDPYTNQLVTNTVNSSNFGLDANLLLWNGSKLSNQYKKTKLEHQAKVLENQQSQKDLDLQIIKAYYQILLNQQLLVIAQQQSQVSKAKVQHFQKLYEAGHEPKSKVIAIKSHWAGEKIRIVKAQSTLKLSTIQLQELINMPVDSTFEVVKVDTTLTNPYQTYTAEMIFEQAKSNLPSLKADQVNAQLYDLNIKIARREMMPSLSLNTGLSTFFSSAAPKRRFVQSGYREFPVEVGYLQSDPTQKVYKVESIPDGYFKDNGFLNQVSYNLSAYVGLRLRVPIYKGDTKTNIALAKVYKEEHEIKKSKVEAALKYNIHKDYNALLLAQSIYNEHLQRFQMLEESMSLVSKQYDNGSISFFEYKQSKSEHDLSQAELVKSRFDLLYSIRLIDEYLR